MTIREDCGASLKGVIDGVNLIYKTTYAMRLDRVIDVYVNGLCRMADLDNGYILQDPYTVQMREPLLDGDTLSVRYNCNPPQVGVANAQPDELVVDDVDLAEALDVSVESDAPLPVTAHVEDEPGTFQATINAC